MQIRKRSIIPLVQRSFPLPIGRLHQIELTSHCNLRCVYCPSPKLKRPKEHMSLATYERALEHVKHYVKAGTQHALNIAGTGESTLHPAFITYLKMARDVIGLGHIIFATNGIKCDVALAEAMVPYDPHVWVSLHRPAEGGKAIQIYNKLGLLKGVSTDPSTNSNSWGGQVDWPEGTVNEDACMWMRDGMGFVMSDGAITTCGMDANGMNIFAHVNDPIGDIGVLPGPLCKTCHRTIGVEGYDQRA